MTITATRRTRSSDARPATSRVFVALANVVTVIVLGIVSLFAAPASAAPLLHSQTRVGVIHVADGQRVGLHEGILAGQGRVRAPGYDRIVVGFGVGAETASAGASYDQMPLFIQTRGADIAVQSTEPEALTARDAVLNGDTTLYKGGNVNSLPPEESQFFAMENPENPGYGDRYGIPPKNLPFDWISSGQLEPGAPFITRPAPGVEGNLGGGIEVVTWPGSFIPDEP